MIRYRDYITRLMLRAEPTTLFVFGDNLMRRGLGGQAKEMRGEPNAVGIPTKVSPNMSEAAFLSDRDFYVWSEEAGPNICRLFSHEGTIIWPKAGIGTGLAQLKRRSPLIWNTIANIHFGLQSLGRLI